MVPLSQYQRYETRDGRVSGCMTHAHPGVLDVRGRSDFTVAELTPRPECGEAPHFSKVLWSAHAPQPLRIAHGAKTPGGGGGLFSLRKTDVL